jgi:hypothetical protein
MENTTDIRNKEIKIKVKADECAMDAIKRYMKRNGFTHYQENRRDLTFDKFYSNEYSEIWVAGQSFNENTNTATFELEGNH